MHLKQQRARQKKEEKHRRKRCEESRREVYDINDVRWVAAHESGYDVAALACGFGLRSARSVRYYGCVLDDGDESLEFFLGNTDSSRFTPEARERIGMFLRRMMSPELKAEILEAVARAA